MLAELLVVQKQLLLTITKNVFLCNQQITSALTT